MDNAFLRRIPWLRELSETEWSALVASASRHAFAAGATVFRPTVDPRSVYLLESGRVRVYRLSAEGEEATLGYVAEGEVFGELPLFGEYPRESFAVAQLRSVVWKLPVTLFRSLVRVRPGVVVEVTRQIGERMKRVETRVESLMLRPVRSRLATMLLELAEDFGEEASDGLLLDLRLSQSELASLIGASRQSVNRALSEFRDAGWVELRDGVFVVRRPDLLRSASKGEGERPPSSPA